MPLLRWKYQLDGRDYDRIYAIADAIERGEYVDKATANALRNIVSKAKEIPQYEGIKL